MEKAKIERTETEVTRDPRGGWRVAIRLGGPVRYVFHFVERVHDDDARELVCADVAIEQPDGEPLAAITAPQVRELADRFEKLQKVAWMQVALTGLDSESVVPSVRTRRELSPRFLRDVARRHAEHRELGVAPTQALAREERVSVGTVKNWLRQAKKLEEESSSTRRTR